MNPLTTKELNQMIADGCQTPGCNHQIHDKLFLHSRCHPKARCSVAYDATTESLVVECGQCRRPIVPVQVASHKVREALERAFIAFGRAGGNTAEGPFRAEWQDARTALGLAEEA